MDEKNLRRQLEGLFSDLKKSGAKPVPQKEPTAEQATGAANTSELDALRAEYERLRQALQEKEFAFQTFLDEIPVGYHELDAEGRITRVNRVELVMLGYTAEEMLGRPAWEFAADPDTSSQAILDNLAGQLAMKTTEREFVRKDGTRLPVLIQDRHLLDAEGNIVGIRTTVQDISERKRAEESLHRQNVELAILHETALGLLNQIEPARLIETILTRAAELAGTSHGYLYVLEPGEQSMVVRVGIGAFADRIGYRLKRGQGVAGKAWEQNAPVVVDDYQTWDGRQPGFDWLHAVASIPLRSGARVIGVISLGHLEPGKTFGQDAVALLDRFAEMASLTLANARLFEVTGRRITELSILNDIGQQMSSASSLEDLYRVVHQQASHMFDTSSFFIGTYEAGSDHWQMAYQIENGQPAELGPRSLKAGLGGYVIRTLKSLVVNSPQELADFYESQHITQLGLPGTKAWMGVPLITAGQIVGVMAIQSYKQENLYSAQDQSLFSTIGAQAAIAIQNARLFEETRQRNAELSGLNEIISSASQTLELKAMLDIVLKQTLQIGGFDGGLITMYNGTRHKLERIVRTGLPGSIPEDPAEGLENSLCAYVFDAREPLIIEDFRKGAPIDVAGEIEAGYYSYIGIPLQARGHRLGTWCGFRKFAGPFGENVLALLQTVCRQIGFAIENARLFEETQAALVETKKLAEALRASQERFTLATKGANDGLWDWDIQGQSLYWSPRLKELLGYADDELQVDFETFNSLMHPDDRAPTGAAIDAHLKDRVLYDVEERLLAKSGEYRWFRARGQAVWDEAGNPIRMVGFSTDITERKQAEAERERLLAVLERRALQLQTAAEVSHAASSILNLDELLPQTVDLIRERFNLYYVGLFLVDESGQSAVLRAGTGEAGQKMIAASHKLKVDDSSMIGSCVAQGKAGVALDAEKAIRYKNPHLPETRSEMALPLISRGRVIGAMTIQSAQPAAFTQEDITILQTMADQVANAIENTRLFEDTKSRLAQLTALQETTKAVASTLELDKLLHLITEQATTLLQGDGGIINLVDWEKKEDEVVADSGSAADSLGVRSPLEGSLSGWVTLHNQPVISNQLQQDSRADTGGRSWRSAVITPLTIKDQVMGTLVVMDKQGGFNQADLDLLTVFANQAATAIENARLFEEARARAEELAVLNEMSRTMSAMFDINAMIKQIYDSTRRLMDTTNFYVALYDARQDEVSFPFYAEGDRIRALPSRRRSGKGLTEYVIHTRAPLLIEEHVTARLEELGVESIGVESQSWLGVPMTVGDQVIGIVAVQSYTTSRLYNQHQRDLLVTIASHAAIAIQNARLFEETRTRAEELAALNDLTRALTGQLTLDGVLEEAYQGASRLMNTKSFAVALYDRDKDEITFPFDIADGQHMEDGITLSSGQGMTGYVIRNRAPLLIKEGVAEWRAKQGIEAIGPLVGAQSWLGVPMIVGDRVLGALIIQSYATPNAFNEHDQEILNAIANQTAIALQNARLFEQAQVRARRERILREVTTRVRSSADPDTIVRTAVRELGTALGRPAFIRLGSPEQLARGHGGDGQALTPEGGESNEAL